MSKKAREKERANGGLPESNIKGKKSRKKASRETTEYPVVQQGAVVQGEPIDELPEMAEGTASAPASSDSPRVPGSSGDVAIPEFKVSRFIDLSQVPLPTADYEVGHLAGVIFQAATNIEKEIDDLQEDVNTKFGEQRMKLKDHDGRIEAVEAEVKNLQKKQAEMSDFLKNRTPVPTAVSEPVVTAAPEPATTSAPEPVAASQPESASASMPELVEASVAPVQAAAPAEPATSLTPAESVAPAPAVPKGPSVLPLTVEPVTVRRRTEGYYAVMSNGGHSKKVFRYAYEARQASPVNDFEPAQFWLEADGSLGPQLTAAELLEEQ